MTCKPLWGARNVQTAPGLPAGWAERRGEVSGRLDLSRQGLAMEADGPGTQQRREG